MQANHSNTRQSSWSSIPHNTLVCGFGTNQAQSRGREWENLMEEVRFESSLSGWIRQAPCGVCHGWNVFADNSDEGTNTYLDLILGQSPC